VSATARRVSIPIFMSSRERTPELLELPVHVSKGFLNRYPTSFQLF
jgi:hypothetical protein